MLSKFLAYLNKRLFYIWLLFFSFLTTIISPEISAYYAIFITSMLYYLLYIFNQRLFLYFVWFIVVTFSLYYPIKLHYGPLNSGIIAAFFETNASESFSFIKNLTLKDFLLPFLFALSAVILIRLMRFNKKDIILNKKEVKHQIILNGVLFFTVILGIFWAPIKYHLDNIDNPDINSDWTLANSPINVISFYANIYRSISEYYIEKEELEEASTVTPPWKILSSQPKYKNYVLVIGESARRDYLSTYGFKLKTSPFLDNTNGYINAGYIAAAPATYHSLLKTLYLKKKNEDTQKQDYSYNIITLAKAAGIKTIWLSNQGSIGKFDTIASRIGAGADFHFFTKKGGYTSNNKDDFVLLDIFKDTLKEHKSEKSRLFVLHLMGSHQQFCDRLNKDDEKYTFINKKMSCYVNTILKTDKLIESLINTLKEQHEAYSLIYFSDHGLVHVNKENIDQMTLDYDGKFKQAYEVPFFKISSDDTERKIVNVKRSAVNFIYGFSQWLGINSIELNDDYDFFSENNDENIEVFDFENNVLFEKLDDDEIPSE